MSGLVTHSTIADLRVEIERRRRRGRTVGLVPTMGFLHAGHVSLMDRARVETDAVLATIFVNPLQFAETEDLADYPRDLRRDTEMCEAAGVDLLFVPSVEEMYPEPVATSVTVAGVSEPLEGRARPTHLAGVATVVAKLFSIVGPCRAYFGEKDYQQLVVIRKMAVDLSLPVTVVGCEIVREDDGLAMSSRNVYLRAEEREQAPVLYRALLHGAEMVEAGETDSTLVEASMTTLIETAPLARIDYVAAVGAGSLAVDGPLSGPVRLLVAVRFGSARLIDNIGCRVGG